MTFATWLAIAIAGPGSLFVLGWFLRDAFHLHRRGPAREERQREDSARS